MGELTAYLPIDRLLALADGHQIPDRARGVVLFADISGFTPLTAALANELGPQRGAEELALQLNLVYSQLIAEAHRFGGSVIAFSGDAVLCWFDEQVHLTADGLRPGPPAEGAPQAPPPTAARAATCAMAMQQVMQRFAAVPTPGRHMIRLGLKIGMAAGPVRRFLVGHPESGLIETLAGAVLDRMAAAEHTATQGEILASEELIAQLGGAIQVRDWHFDDEGRRFAVIDQVGAVAPTPWAAPAEIPHEAIRSWLLPPVYERLAYGEGEFLTELRPVTALFLSFSGIEYDQDDTAGARLDTLIRRVQAVMGHYEGYLVQLTIGDKGSYLYGVFGAPIAHEGGAQRAVAAALELRTLPEQLAGITNVRIGISHGRMRVGAYGSPTRRTYGVLGNETNMAARLMGRAEAGQILLTPPAAEAVRETYELQDLGATAVKGRDRPIRIFAALGWRQHREAGTLKGRVIAPIVGREAERARMAAWVEQLCLGGGGCLLIEGEAGIGKSRLVAELQAQIAAAGGHSLFGVASSIEQATAYYVWRPIFSQILGVDTFGEAPRPESRQLWREAALGYLSRHMPGQIGLAPLLNVVLPLDLPESELTAQMTGEVRAVNTIELLTGILSAAALERRLVLILEDAHWLDSASWALARIVVREVATLLLVIVARPMGQPAPPDYTQLAQAAGTETITLHTLPPADIDRLICQRLGVGELPPELTALILEKSEGHPFFSEELAYALRDAGLIIVADGTCRLAPGVENFQLLSFPDTIEGVIISRIDWLPARFQLTLKVASVIGRIFAFRILHAVHPIDSDRTGLPEHLSNLERLDITLLESAEPDLAYLFKHIITQEVAYNLITFAQRRELHRVVAEWYEREYAADLTPFYDLLAYHWGRAEHAERAIDYLERAGEQALHSNANQEAARFFSGALELAQSAGLAVGDLRRARWLTQLGQAHYRLGNMVDSKAYLRTALDLLGMPLPKTPRRLTAALLRQAGRQLRHRLQGGRLAMPASHAEHKRLVAATEVFKALLPIYYITNETNDFLLATLASVNLAEQVDLHADIAEGYATLGILAGLMRPAWADAYFNRAIELARGLRAPLYVLGITHSRRGIYRSTTGNRQGGLEDYSYALAYFRQLNDQRSIGDCLNYYMRTYYGMGRAHDGLSFSVALSTAARKSGNAQHEGWGLMFEAMNLLLLQRWEAAEARADQAAAVLGKHISDTDRLHIEGVRAVTAMRRGDRARALELAASVAKIVLESPPLLAGIATGFNLALEVYLPTWEARMAAGAPAGETRALGAMVRQLCAGELRFARFFAAQLGEAQHWWGRYAWALGQHAEARRWWARSLRTAAAQGDLYIEARTRSAIAASLPPDSTERPAQLRRASECLAALGLTADS